MTQYTREESSDSDRQSAYRRPSHPHIQPLSAEQLRHLFTAAQGDPMHVFFLVAGTTGMHIGEVLALKRWPLPPKPSCRRQGYRKEVFTICARAILLRMGAHPDVVRAILGLRPQKSSVIVSPSSETLPKLISEAILGLNKAFQE